MKQKLFLAFLASMLAGNVCSLAAQEAPGIKGQSRMKINETLPYSLATDSEVTSYEWQAPRGSRIASGQGTPEIQLSTTFLSQDGNLRAILTLQDDTKDTLTFPIAINRYIKEFHDHTILEGEEFELCGEKYKEADIYYEPLPMEEGAFDQVIAHRLTVVPREGVYSEMTKPYLQTATSSSIWIGWKTNFSNAPVVRYGKEKDDLNLLQEGISESLSDSYFWNSVKLEELEADTFYYYQVESDGKKSEIYRFRTMPEEGGKTPLRILLMGDHQLKSRSGYEWLIKAAQRKIDEKYGGPMEEHIHMVMNIGDQVDVGSLDQYEQIHLFKSQWMSPNLPIMTAVGNHDTYQDTDMHIYSTHFHYEELEYQGIRSGTENYYAYQAGRILFVVLSTEHTGSTQKEWVRKIVDAAKTDDSVDFIISVNHRPIQAEQYIGDISPWARYEIMPILSETPKHVLNYGGHHHLYHRGQLTDYPLYHIINGAASWDQMWGMSSEKDYDDVQKTIDYWGYQILEFDFEKKEMKAECYAIGNKKLTIDNLLIDSFSRTLEQPAPEQPQLREIPEILELPFTFEGSDYHTEAAFPLNTTQFQFSVNPDFSTVEYNVVRDFENLYGSTGDPYHIPLDLHENMDITQLTIENNQLKNGTYYVRLRYRDSNVEWSEWSATHTFTVEGSIDGDPGINLSQTRFELHSPVVINYEFAPVNQNAWIAVYRKGDKPGTGAGTSTSYKWAYTDGVAGTVQFTIGETNEYYAVLFEDEGYTEISPRIAFYVGEAPELSLQKTIYKEGEAVQINYKNAPGFEGDWIGIYKMGHTPGKENSASWTYTGQAHEGAVSLGAGLGKGYYFVSYFTYGEYFEPAERVFFSVGEEISTVSVEKAEYGAEEEIRIFYQEGPGTPKDWVGVYLEGKVVDVDELDGFYYTYGATEGHVTIPAGELKPGKYFCSLFINDSYDEVSGRDYFIIYEEGDSGTGEIMQSLPTLRVYSDPVGKVWFIESDTYTEAVLISLSGQTIQATKLDAGKGSMDLSPMKPGIYLLQLKSEGSTETVKVVRE